MPYQAKYEYRQDGDIRQRWQDGPSSYTPPTEIVAGNYPKDRFSNFNRQGSNFNIRKVKDHNKSCYPDGGYEWRLVVAPLGRKLAYKVWSKRLNKYVWARKDTLVWRLVRIKKPKFKKIKKGQSDLLPNNLTYTSYLVANTGGPSNDGIATVFASRPSDNKSWMAEGLLSANFLPFSANWVPGLNVANFMSNVISSQYISIGNTLDQPLLSKLYAKVKDQKVNLAQVIAERRQTMKLISDAFAKLLKVYRYAKSGKITRAVKELIPKSSGDIADLRLAYVYGVKPLLQDIEGMVDELTDGSSTMFDVIVSRTVPIKDLLLGESSGPFGVTWFEEKAVSNGRVRVKYKVRLRIDSSMDAALQSFSRLGFTNLNQLAWELTPFSFVADWFIPIGNYLANQDAFSGLSVVSVQRTIFCEEYITYNKTIGGPKGYFSCSPVTTGFIVKKIHVSRQILPNVPELLFPDFRDPTSKDHILNAIALATNFRK